MDWKPATTREMVIGALRGVLEGILVAGIIWAVGAALIALIVLILLALG